jgi:hypothetical protein
MLRQPHQEWLRKTYFTHIVKSKDVEINLWRWSSVIGVPSKKKEHRVIYMEIINYWNVLWKLQFEDNVCIWQLTKSVQRLCSRCHIGILILATSCMFLLESTQGIHPMVTGVLVSWITLLGHELTNCIEWQCIKCVTVYLGALKEWLLGTGETLYLSAEYPT